MWHHCHWVWHHGLQMLTVGDPGNQVMVELFLGLSMSGDQRRKTSCPFQLSCYQPVTQPISLQPRWRDGEAGGVFKRWFFLGIYMSICCQVALWICHSKCHHSTSTVGSGYATLISEQRNISFILFPSFWGRVIFVKEIKWVNEKQHFTREALIRESLN